MRVTSRTPQGHRSERRCCMRILRCFESCGELLFLHLSLLLFPLSLLCGNHSGGFLRHAFLLGGRFSPGL